MHGGGGNDIFTFCENWGADTVQQRAFGTVTLWFASGDISNWDAAAMTYTDGENSVKVSGARADAITFKFGDDGSEEYAKLSDMGAFDAFSSQGSSRNPAKESSQVSKAGPLQLNLILFFPPPE